MKRYKVSVTTDGSGVATVYRRGCPASSSRSSEGRRREPVRQRRRLHHHREATGKTLWTESDVNASKVSPRQPTHSTAGVAAPRRGRHAVNDRIALANTRVKIAIAQGGATKVGAFHILVD